MSYHELSVAAKIRYHLERNREPSVLCPRCEAALQPGDLLAHVRERCEGLRQPHHRSQWVTRSEALAMGASKDTLRRWVTSGRVRVQGTPSRRKYLLRDVVRNLALKHL